MDSSDAARERLYGLLCVGLTVTALLLPAARGAATWTPDSMEHLAIANATLQGSGFFDPVQYNYYLSETSPLPAFAVRAPVVPLLLTLPLAAGLSIDAIGGLHTLWAVAVALFCYWAASGFMRPWAAAAAVIAWNSSFAWLAVSLAPFNEVTASLVLTAVVVSARGVLRSSPGALACSALIVLAWMTRPNLGLMVAAVGGGVIWHLGPRRAIRHVPLYVFAGGFIVLYGAVRVGVEALTGLAPYEGYGVALQHLDSREWNNYSQTYAGTWLFVVAHYTEIWQIAVGRIPQVFTAVCLTSVHNGMGWLIPIGLAHAAARWRRIPLEQAVLTLAVLGFLATQMAKYSDFERFRYPLQMIQCGVMAGFLSLGELVPTSFGKLTGRRFSPRGALLVATCAGLALAAHRAWTLPVIAGAEPSGGISRALCRAMAPDALVATSRMWIVHARCGNATIRLPADHKAPGVMQRFLRDRRPAYVLDRWAQLEPSSASLQEVERGGKLAVFRVAAGEARAVWKAPPPMMCQGRTDCSWIDGRLLPP